MRTAIFYDTETTGTDTAFDQMLQFAAIKTDDDLNVIDQFNVRCRLLPWVVPSPGALVITGVTPNDLTQALSDHRLEVLSQVPIDWAADLDAVESEARRRGM